MVFGDGVGDVLQHHGLAGLRRGDQEATLAGANRCNHVDNAAGGVFFAAHLALELEVTRRVQRCQVFKQNLVLRGFRRLVVDAIHFHQREIAFAILGGANLAFDRVAGVQIEAADLRRADVDVVGAGQVRDIRRTQETKTVWQHFQSAVSKDALAFLGLILQQGKNKFLLAQAVGAVDAVGSGHFKQLADVKTLEFGKTHRGIGWAGEVWKRVELVWMWLW